MFKDAGVYEVLFNIINSQNVPANTVNDLLYFISTTLTHLKQFLLKHIQNQLSKSLIKE